jgi:hypothetical protein
MRVKIAVSLLRFRWKIFGFYYDRLAIQAYYLYRQSDLFKNRWREMGLQFAEDSFAADCRYFFSKAKHEPIGIRARLFWDGLTKKPLRTYYLRN